MKNTLEIIQGLGFQVQKGRKSYYAVSVNYKKSLIEGKTLTALLDNISIFLKEVHLGKDYNQLNTEDGIRDIAIRITDRLVELGFVPNCIDSDDETEFEVQDEINEILNQSLNK